MCGSGLCISRSVFGFHPRLVGNVGFSTIWNQQEYLLNLVVVSLEGTKTPPSSDLDNQKVLLLEICEVDMPLDSKALMHQKSQRT